MDASTEGRLLRLAIAKGLLTWDDLDQVVEGLAEEEHRGERSWLRLVLAAGLLDEGEVSRLQAELNATESTAGTGTVPFPPEHRFLAGWPRYRVERLLGSGGMGTVFLAFDPALDRRVALKLLHRNDPEQTGRFLREARAQARVEHPNICRVHEVGEVEGRPYIAMQHIEGKNLSDLRGQLSPEAIVRLVRDVARAIQAAHKTGLIHRDLKPANILVGTAEGDLHPYVVDFGLARDQEDTALSRTGMISGTPSYLSPEQAQGIPLDRRSDVYSLGVILYEMLSGQPPFQGVSPAHVLVRILQEEAPPLRRIAPSVPPDLETIVMKCLEKDPARRYDSARALAEDLDRWLEGEPIAARPAGWLYRTGKRLRKHWLLATVSAAACVALLVLGATVLYTRWQAQERAEMAQSFGQRAERLQSYMRFSAFLPRHDMRPAKRELRRQLDEIRSEMKRLGPLAEGPGSYALGQGYLVLRRYEDARLHLEKAWNAGERQPEVAAALADALFSLYEKALVEASRSRTADARKALREELDQTLRQPALAYLREGLRGETRPSPYLEALLAFHEKRYDEAAAKAREAHRQIPWFYEAGQLEADTYITRAEEAADQENAVAAVALFDRGGEIYRGLLAAVPSDISLHASECLRQVRRLDMFRGQDTQDNEDAALAACGRALEVDSELSDVVSSMAWIWWTRAFRQGRRGIDPLPALDHSIRFSRAALDLQSSEAGAWKSLAAAYRTKAQWELGRGIDPVPSLRSSIEASARTVELQPERASSHNDLGMAYVILANDEIRRGVDPRGSLRRALASQERALQLNPRLLSAFANLGNTWNLLAEAQIARGQDPSNALTRAAAAFEKAAQIPGPDQAPVHNNLGNTWLTLAEYQIARGLDPIPALDRAAASYRKALAVRPDYPYGAYNLALTEKDRALARLDRGQDPAPALATAHAHVEESLRINPTDADNFLEQARLHLLSARWKLRQKSLPGPDLDRADAALAKAEALNPGSPEIFQTQAESARYRAEAALARNGRPQEAIQGGLARLVKALAIRPEDARSLALQGALWHLAARAETDPARRAEASAQAAASLEKALRLNPLLQREYGPVRASLTP